jgi:hypothetical protein
MAASPSITNYQIPTGKVYFKKTGEAAFRDLGNVLNFSLENTIEKKDHFRSYGGRRTKDKTVITQTGATITFTMDEITAPNLAFFALSGSGATDTDDAEQLSGMTETSFTGTLRIIGDNDVGPQVDWEGDVSFIPSGSFSFVKNDDEWNVIEVTAEVQEDANGAFGVWAVREGA